MIGPDPAEITRSVQVLVATGAAGGAGPNAGVLPRFFDPPATRDLILELIEAGASRFVLAPVGFQSPRALADEIVEPVLAAIR